MLNNGQHPGTKSPLGHGGKIMHRHKDNKAIPSYRALHLVFVEVHLPVRLLRFHKDASLSTQDMFSQRTVFQYAEDVTLSFHEF